MKVTPAAFNKEKLLELYRTKQRLILGLCVLSRFSRIRLLVTLWTLWLLCPWDHPGKNTGVGCHALLQGIFPT